MRSRRVWSVVRPQCRSYVSALGLQRVRVLSDTGIDTFREEAFKPAIPALLPRRACADLPAIDRWFTRMTKEHYGLQLEYLAEYGDAIVPLELSSEDTFVRVEQPLRMFLEASTGPNPTTRIYLAQAPIPDIPQGLGDDVPTPNLVLKAGKGDLYDSSIWLGNAPTYTPLHRDPNPNLFVQLAGKKIVRLFRPEVGNGIFAKVQERIGVIASATMRGEEMMQGEEKMALEKEVWETEDGAGGFEAELESGDGLFIPKGWWHSIKGVGEGMTGSVNWWFR